MTTKLTT